MTNYVLRLIFLGPVCFACMTGAAGAQHIRTDGSVGAAQSLTGPDYTIGASLGRQSGANLFHSFSSFSLSAGEVATFSGPGSIANIVARVTGGAVSNIDGTIACTIAGADIFLINPSGLIFGPNAALNLTGSFHASTANYLGFADGTRFASALSGGSSFTIAAPVAFGFLGSNSAAIAVNGSTLTVPTGKAISLIGGAVAMSQAALTAPSGAVTITAAASAGEIPVLADGVATIPVKSFGNVSLSNGSSVDISDKAGQTSGGRILIRGGALTIDNSGLVGDNYGTGQGGSMTLEGQAILFQNGGFATATAAGTGSSGQIAITGGDLSLINGGSITSFTKTAGDAGEISLNLAGALLIDGNNGVSGLTGIFSQALDGSTGASGRVSITADKALLTGGAAAIGSDATSAGAAGGVTISAKSSMSIEGTGQQQGANYVSSLSTGSGASGGVTISTPSLVIKGSSYIETDTFGAGAGGDIAINAGTLLIDGTNSAGNVTTGLLARSVLSADAAPPTGAAGAIRLNLADLTILNTGQIASGSNYSGRGGDIQVSAKRIKIDGSAQPQYFTGISSLAQGAGNAGNIAIVADQISLNAGLISSAVSGGLLDANGHAIVASGNAGTITINAGGLSMSNGAVISSSSTLGSDINGAAGQATGDAGLVQLTAANLSLSSGASISSVTGEAGLGGDVRISAGSFSIDGSGAPAAFTGISAQALGSGNAGQVVVNAGSLALKAGGAISSSASGSGDAGLVQITVGSLLIDGAGNAVNAAGIFNDSNTTATGGAGDVVINAGSLAIRNSGRISSDNFGGMAPNNPSQQGGRVVATAGSIEVSSGGQIATSTFGSASGGDIQLTATNGITVSGRGANGDGSAIVARSTGSGSAGTIGLTARSVSVTDGAEISTQAQVADGGNVTIQAKDLVYVRNADIATSVKGGFGSGGNITIDPTFVVLQNARIVADAVAGHGGNITIAADNYFADPLSIVRASSQLGISGNVVIQAPQVDLNGDLVVLASDYGQTVSLVANSCVGRSGDRSSLVAATKGGLAFEPGGAQPSLYFANRPATDLAENSGPTDPGFTTHLAGLPPLDFPGRCP
jgi:filamentous hemagglutinin family protein